MTQLLLKDDEVNAAILGHGGFIGVLDGVEVALGEDFELVGSDAGGGQVLLGGVGATIAETEVVFSSALPVAVAFEEDASSGIRCEVGLGGFQLGTLGGLDAGLVEVEVNRVALEGIAIAVSEIVGSTCTKSAVRVENGTIGKATNSSTRKAAFRANYSSGRIGAAGFFGATGECDNGGDENEAEFLSGEVHVER